MTKPLAKGTSRRRKKRTRPRLSLFGIWKDRPEMSDPVAYVESLRKKHERRGNDA